MLGISALAPEDPARTAALIACVCLADSSACARVDHAVDMLRIGSAVAARRKSHSPVGYLAQAGTELAVAGVLADPAVLRRPDTRPREPGPRPSSARNTRLTTRQAPGSPAEVTACPRDSAHG